MSRKAKHEPEDLKADIDAVIEAAGGERAAIRKLLIAQAYYEADVFRLSSAFSQSQSRREPAAMIRQGR